MDSDVMNSGREGIRGEDKGLGELVRVLGALNAGDLRVRASLEGLPDTWGNALGGLNSLADSLVGVIDEVERMSAEHEKGDIEVVIDAARFKGSFQSLAQGINDMVTGHIQTKKKAMICVAQFAEGNFDAPLEQFRGKKSFVNNHIEALRGNLKALVADANILSVAAVDGKLATRADATKHQGDFRKIVQGVNDTLDAVIGPLNVAATYVDQISKGAIPAKITDSYNGDFNTIKNNLNTCIDAVNALVGDANMLSVAAVEGKLATRADATKHQGDFRKIVQGVNDTLDAVIGPLNVAATYVDQISKGAIPAKITDSYNGDFNTIKNNLNTCIDAVNAIIMDAGRMSQAVVDGELDLQVDASRHQGDYRKIIDAFENAFEGLNNTFFQLGEKVEQVGMSAEQLNAASQNVASTSEEQSSSVEEVTASLEQTDSQVKANTDNANAANQLVMGTAEAASQGQSKMESMMVAMNSISDSAQNIAKIIKVIDEIAFQTNLLALNAAVEAARAGQHGRGFAVVAQEVRNLAGRSAKAARETAELIDDSGKRVEEGVMIAGQTREALNQIVTNVVKVKDLVAEIATASTEQARGVSQINVAMNQVAKAAQEGSQQAEELAAAAGQLTSVTNQMRTEVRRFKLRDRKASAASLSLQGLDGLTPEMLAQIKALLMNGNGAPAQRSNGAAPRMNGKAPRVSPRAVLPLDHDERGFGDF